MAPLTFDEPDNLIAIFCKAKKPAIDLCSCSCRGAVKLEGSYSCIRASTSTGPFVLVDRGAKCRTDGKDGKEEQWAEIGARKNVQASIRPECQTQKSFYLKIFCEPI
jgi:hypothetical protein